MKKWFLENWLLALMTISLFAAWLLVGCPDSTVNTELERCLLLNQKIDLAKQRLAAMDAKMAEIDGYPAYQVGGKICEFDLASGKTKTLIYWPIGKMADCPVVLFSHGLTASAESQLYLLQGLARRGYVVIAPDHADPVSYDRIGLLDSEINKRRIDVVYALTSVIWQLVGAEVNGTWNAYVPVLNLSEDQLLARRDDGELLDYFLDTFSFRPADISGLWQKLPELNDDYDLAGRMDTEKIILAGHSLGGTTALSLALKNDPRVKAVVCLSPASHFFSAEMLASIQAPILFMTGDLDGFHDEVLRAFDASKSPAMFQSVKAGGHIIFTDFPFLYGAGIPFASNGANGYATQLPSTKSVLYPDYAAQLENFQGKALAITRTVAAFITGYGCGDEACRQAAAATANCDLFAETAIK